jgi:ABC-2 type transport system ATP-binding protein
MIKVEDVSKYYGSHCAVEDLSFEVEQGECVGFLGLNGAGKTTALRLLSCLLLPTSGRISVGGLDVVERPHEIRKQVGFLPENPPLYPEMTVSEYLGFAARLRGMQSKQAEKRQQEVIELCHLKEASSSTIGTLSHGFRQRVGIAQAVIHAPALLILDEPIKGLDPLQIVEMRKMLGSLRGKHTILLSTHILSEIEQTCDRILMMHRGRIAAEGTEQELAERYGSSRAMEMVVRGEEADLRAALQKLDDISDLRIEPGGSGTVVARVRVPEAEREKLSRAVVEAGLGLLGLRSVSTGLENVFLTLSTGQAASAQAAGNATGATAPSATDTSGG